MDIFGGADNLIFFQHSWDLSPQRTHPALELDPESKAARLIVPLSVLHVQGSLFPSGHLIPLIPDMQMAVR